MHISSIQNYRAPQKTSFKSFTISAQAMQIARRNCENMKVVKRAERLFGNSNYVDFAILDNFIPKISLKSNHESILDKITARLIGNNAISVSDGKKSFDFVLPVGYTAEYQTNLINAGIYDKAGTASHIAELMELSGEDHNGRFLL